MKITKKYIEGLKNIHKEMRSKNGMYDEAVNYLMGYTQALINLYEAENEQN